MPDLGNTLGDSNPSGTTLNATRAMPFYMPSGSWQLDSITAFKSSVLGTEHIRLALYAGGTADNDITGATLVEDLGFVTATESGADHTIMSSSNPAMTGPSQRYWLVWRASNWVTKFTTTLGDTDFAEKRSNDLAGGTDHTDPFSGYDPWPTASAGTGSGLYALYITYSAASGGGLLPHVGRLNPMSGLSGLGR